MDLPFGIEGPDAFGAWVKVSGGGGMVGTDIGAIDTSPVREVEFASNNGKLSEICSFSSSQ